MFKPHTIKSAGQCGRAMHAPTGLIDITISSVGVGAKRLRSKLYAERSEAARQTRLLDVILPKAFPSGEGAEL